jgi:hypothetical protein
MRYLFILIVLFVFNQSVSQTQKPVMMRIYAYSIDEYDKNTKTWKEGKSVEMSSKALMVLDGSIITIYWNTKETYHIFDGKNDSIGAMKIDIYQAVDDDGVEYSLMFMLGSNGFKKLILTSKNATKRRSMYMESE